MFAVPSAIDQFGRHQTNLVIGGHVADKFDNAGSAGDRQAPPGEGGATTAGHNLATAVLQQHGPYDSMAALAAE